MATETCQRCEATWESRVKDPKACPSCKSRLWRRPRAKDHRPGRPLSQLGEQVKAMAIGDVISREDLMIGRDPEAVVWTRSAIRSGRNLGYVLVTEPLAPISGKPPAVRRVT